MNASQWTGVSTGEKTAVKLANNFSTALNELTSNGVTLTDSTGAKVNSAGQYL